MSPATDVDAAGEGLPINEVFYSLQGEGTLLVVCPSVFVRTSGCNLRCWFCDCTIRRGSRPGRGATSTRSLRRVPPTKQANHVVLTGGEPLIPESIELWNDWLQTGIIRRWDRRDDLPGRAFDRSGEYQPETGEQHADTGP